MKQIHITMPDGSIWAVPAEIVARNCAECFARANGSARSKEDYRRILSDNGELLDWAENAGTQRPGDAEATNATRAIPPGSLE